MGKDRVIRFAVVGVGAVGELHLDSITKARGAELVAICDKNKELLMKQKSKYKVDIYTDFSEMLRREDIDVVNICTPSGMHGELIEQAARAGKHVICEKPLEISVEKADRAIATCREHGVKLAGILQSRLLPANEKIKRTVEAGRLGDIIMANARILWYRPQEYYDKGGWRGTWQIDGGGALMNQSIHTIDLMQWIAGPVKSVYAKGGTFAHEMEAEDLGIALVTFKNGAVGSITGSTCVYPGLDASIEIVGKKGTIVSRDNQITTWNIQGGNELEESQEILATYGSSNCGSGASDPMAISNMGHILQIEDMVNAILEDREPIVNGEEARKSVAIICGIYESMRTGKEVVIS